MNSFAGISPHTCVEMLRALGVTTTPYTSFTPTCRHASIVVEIHRPRESEQQIAALYDEIVGLVTALAPVPDVFITWVFTSVHPSFNHVLATLPDSRELIPYTSVDPDELRVLFSDRTPDYLVARFKNSKMEPLCVCVVNTDSPSTTRAMMTTIIGMELDVGEVGNFCERYKKAAHWVFSDLAHHSFAATTYGRSHEEAPLGVATTQAMRVAYKTAAVGWTGLRLLKWPAIILLFLFAKAAFLTYT